MLETQLRSASVRPVRRCPGEVGAEAVRRRQARAARRSGRARPRPAWRRRLRSPRATRRLRRDHHHGWPEPRTAAVIRSDQRGRVTSPPRRADRPSASTTAETARRRQRCQCHRIARGEAAGRGRGGAGRCGRSGTDALSPRACEPRPRRGRVPAIALTSSAACTASRAAAWAAWNCQMGRGRQAVADPPERRCGPR